MILVQWATVILYLYQSYFKRYLLLLLSVASQCVWLQANAVILYQIKTLESRLTEN